MLVFKVCWETSDKLLDIINMFEAHLQISQWILFHEKQILKIKIWSFISVIPH